MADNHSPLHLSDEDTTDLLNGSFNELNLNQVSTSVVTNTNATAHSVPCTRDRQSTLLNYFTRNNPSTGTNQREINLLEDRPTPSICDTANTATTQVNPPDTISNDPNQTESCLRKRKRYASQENQGINCPVLPTNPALKNQCNKHVTFRIEL
jgi:hypothetical protein